MAPSMVASPQFNLHIYNIFLNGLMKTKGKIGKNDWQGRQGQPPYRSTVATGVHIVEYKYSVYALPLSIGDLNFSLQLATLPHNPMRS